MFVVGALALVIIFSAYFYSIRNHDYWRKRNVKYVTPVPFFGAEICKLFKKNTMTERAIQVYNAFPDEKLIGYFNAGTPELLIKDPLLLKHVLLLDFEYLQGRTGDVELPESLFNHFSISKLDYWRHIEQSLMATLSVSKIKKMYPLIVNCAQRLQTLGDKIIRKGGVTTAQEIMSRFTIEIIYNCGVGIDLDVIMDANSEFYNFTYNAFKRTKWQNLWVVIGEILHLPKCLRLPYCLNTRMQNVIYNMIIKVCKSKHFKSSARNDFIDLLLESAAKRQDKKRNAHDTLEVKELDLADPKVILAQVFIFILAGFETTTSATSFTLHQLAHHPKILKKVQDQIDEVLIKYDNKLCFDAVLEMTFLEMAFEESMRLVPPFGIIRRVCTKKYTFPGTNVTIDPGLSIVIPTAAIHNDSKYYPDPNKFKLERFTAEEITKRDKYVYLPFGQGKRTCIGKRLAQMQSLAALASLLQRFSIEPAPHSPRHLKVNRASRLVHEIDGGVPIKLTPRVCHNNCL